ncbi:MAG TPA: acyl-CoA dehydrogenase family protein [Polyangiaceae bacterium]|jgi:butyryl-CoA dehydrogenase|nr:acyl-CoA dehydrogenase family protein [Polyangiaceae bacterium]
MDFELTEEQKLVQQTARDFSTREIEPKAAELDKNARWPTEIVARMAELGFLGLAVPEEYGGAGLDNVSYVLVMEEVSRACASSGVIMSVNNSLFCDPLLKFGTDWQKTEILTPTASGKILGAFGLTEPASGSDARTMLTVAERQGDGGYILNGSKNFITVGPEAEHIIVFAITEQHPERPKHTALIVKRDMPGFSLSPHDEKLGIKAAHSCSIFFENVRVPKEYVLGEDGMGFKIAMMTLDGGRIGIAAQALGIARAAHEKAVAYAKERKAFGGVIAKLQAIQFMIADMAMEIDAARLLTLRAAAMKDKGVKHTAESAMAKLLASEMSTRVTHKALQVHGGYGYTTEYGVERHYRDARITEIYEGTSEIQRLVIAGSVLR